MAEHINLTGQFESDKYAVWNLARGEWVTPDKVVLSFHDPRAVSAIKLFAASTDDAELAADIKTRLRVVENEMRAKGTE